MTAPTRVAFDPLPITSLSTLLRQPKVLAAWEARLPGTDQVLAALNQGLTRLYVPPSFWTDQKGEFATLGTAFDYAVGALWAGESLSPVFQRVTLATRADPSLAVVVSALAQLLLHELPARLPDRELTPTQRDALRGLGLLAHLDAAYRSGKAPPPWTRELARGPVLSQAALERQLQVHYPDAFVDELYALLRAALADLPRGARILYDPSFGSPPGLEHVRADGDLIVDDTLIELKVSSQPYARGHLWQLLGYVALDRLLGHTHVHRVALYNPRYRYFWSETAERLAARLGAGSLQDFSAWFRDTPEAHTH